MAKHTENWDDDFEVETRSNSPLNLNLSTSRRRDTREEGWDDELKLSQSWTVPFGGSHDLLVAAITRNTNQTRNYFNFF